MAEEITIANVTACGLVSKQYICVEASCYDTKTDLRVLLPFTQDGKYGLMDKSRNIVLEAKYDIIIDSAYTHDDLIRVGVFNYVNFASQGKKPNIYRQSLVGIIDIKGTFVIPMMYRSIVMPYKSHLFTVREKISNDYGVIDINNKIIVPIGQYQYIDGFSHGYARVKSKNGWGIIDEAGTEVLPCSHSNIWSFYKKDYTTAVVITAEGQRMFNFEQAKLLTAPIKLTPKISDHDVYIADDYGTHYGEFEGTYAQDIAGYDDDTINDAFDGDPDAYWNID